MKMDWANIKVEGHIGSWHVIDSLYLNGKTYHLLEHNTYGEDANHIAIDAHGNLILEEVVGGIVEIAERLEADMEQLFSTLKEEEEA